MRRVLSQCYQLLKPHTLISTFPGFTHQSCQILLENRAIWDRIFSGRQYVHKWEDYNWKLTEQVTTTRHKDLCNNLHTLKAICTGSCSSLILAMGPVRDWRCLFHVCDKTTHLLVLPENPQSRAGVSATIWDGQRCPSPGLECVRQDLQYIYSIRKWEYDLKCRCDILGYLMLNCTLSCVKVMSRTLVWHRRLLLAFSWWIHQQCGLVSKLGQEQ